MKLRLVAARIVIGLTLFSAGFAAQAAEHITLGRTILLGNANQGAKIPLLVCRKTDAIQITAEKDLKLNKVVITFQNGDKKTISFYRELKKGQVTKWRKFAYKRCVKNIDVFGHAEHSTAGVKVLGRKN